MMKKVYFLIIMMLILAIPGCGKKADNEQDNQNLESVTVTDSSEQQNDDDDSASEQGVDALGGDSVVNPMQELTDEEEINELSYGLILPKGAEQDKTFLINDRILERRFVVDGADYTMRVAKGDAFEDISGLYYEWSSQMDISYPTEESVHMVYSDDGEYVDVFNWYDKELSVNYSVSAIDDKQIGGLSICLDQMIPISVKNRKPADYSEERIPGLPEISKIEDGFNSIRDWAGLQAFYDGIVFDELTDDVKVAMAVYCAQANEEEIIFDESGSYQILSEDKIKAAMVDLFGKESEIKATEDVCEKSHFEIKPDKTVYVRLGDWGLVCPEVEIISAGPSGDESDEFYYSILFYPHDLENDHVDFNLPSYLCRGKGKIDENSKYGFVITELDGSIQEE